MGFYLTLHVFSPRPCQPPRTTWRACEWDKRSPGHRSVCRNKRRRRGRRRDLKFWWSSKYPMWLVVSLLKGLMQECLEVKSLKGLMGGPAGGFSPQTDFDVRSLFSAKAFLTGWTLCPGSVCVCADCTAGPKPSTQALHQSPSGWLRTAQLNLKYVFMFAF